MSAAQRVPLACLGEVFDWCGCVLLLLLFLRLSSLCVFFASAGADAIRVASVCLCVSVCACARACSLLISLFEKRQHGWGCCNSFTFAPVCSADAVRCLFFFRMRLPFLFPPSLPLYATFPSSLFLMPVCVSIQCPSSTARQSKEEGGTAMRTGAVDITEERRAFHECWRLAVL